MYSYIYIYIFKYIKYMKICARNCPEGSERVKYGPKWSKKVIIKIFIKNVINISIKKFSLKTGPEGSEATPAPLRTRGSVRKNLTKIIKII